jgi:hypothetical protein
MHAVSLLVRTHAPTAPSHRWFYGLNLACPDFPAAVFSVTVMAAPATGFFASPVSVASPAGTSAIVSRSGPRDTSADAVKPWVATGLLPSPFGAVDVLRGCKSRQRYRGDKGEYVFHHVSL